MLHWLLVAIFLALLFSVSCSGQNTKSGESALGSEWEEVPSPPIPSSFNKNNDSEVRTIRFQTTEGTFIAVDVSPKGEKVVFDLLGDLYLLPIEGGEAQPLTHGRAWDQAPRFSPDGSEVYFVSDREGFKNIWRVNIDDGSTHRITDTKGDVLGSPNWTFDGSRLLAGIGTECCNVDRNSEIFIHSVHPNSGALDAINKPAETWYNLETLKFERQAIQIFSAVEVADRRIYYAKSQIDPVQRRVAVRLRSFEPATKKSQEITPPSASFDEFSPQVSRDGKRISFFRDHYGGPVELVIRDLETNTEKSLATLKDAYGSFYSTQNAPRPNYAFTPNDDGIVFSNAGKIWRVDTKTGAQEEIPFTVDVAREVRNRVVSESQTAQAPDSALVVRWPELLNDGTKLLFVAGGHIWIRDLRVAIDTRVTYDDELAYMPALSPDETRVAYIGFDKSSVGPSAAKLIVINLETAERTQLLSDENETYLIPAWSHDGTKIALIREQRDEQSLVADVGWIQSDGGDFNSVAPISASDMRINWPGNTRYVGFDAQDSKIIISNAWQDDPIVRVKTVSLDGSETKDIATGGAKVVGMVPTRSLDKLALTKHDGSIWVVPFEFDEYSSPQQLTVLDTAAIRVSPGAGNFARWRDAENLIFAFGKRVYNFQNSQQSVQSLDINVRSPVSVSEQVVAFVGAKIVTMADENPERSIINNGVIVTRGDRVESVGEIDLITIPKDAVVVDVAGATIIPGLIDTHYHALSGNNLSGFGFPHMWLHDKSAIQYGVTTAWEPGGAANDAVAANVDLRTFGRVPGPRWSHSAMGSVGFPFDLLVSPQAAIAAVQQHMDMGVQILKEYNTPTREQRQWLVEAADQNGLGIISHLQGYDQTMTRVVDGFTGGDHPYIPTPVYKDVSELMVQTGYIWTPNVTITPKNGTGKPGERKRDYYCDALHSWRSNNEDAPASRGPFCFDKSSELTAPIESHRFFDVARFASDLSKKGGKIGVSAHDIPAWRLNRELYLLNEGGMVPYDVLYAATVINSEKIGLQNDVGSIEVGKIADFLILSQNPLQDILHTLSIDYTVQGGIIFDANTAEAIAADTLSKTIH